jgi:hypothetical protein
MNVKIHMSAWAAHGLLRVSPSKEDYKEAIQINQSLAELHEVNVRKFAAQADETVKFNHYIGTWDCELSPFGLCAYNALKDRGKDSCIYCEQPDERK